MEGGPRRNFSSDMMNVVQTRTPVIGVTLQEVPMIGTCLINIREPSRLAEDLQNNKY